MNLTRWQPFNNTDEFFRAFSPPMFGRLPRLFDEESGSKFEWSPAADISETEMEYLVKAELPGVKREDVKVSLDDGVLTIEGERKHEKEAKGEKTHRVERFYGTFCRSFILPKDADSKLIRAESRDGMLSVHVPKLAADKPKSVPIKID